MQQFVRNIVISTLRPALGVAASVALPVPAFSPWRTARDRMAAIAA